MTALLNLLLVNAITVVPLAAVVWMVGRIVRRPALVHALWMIVLLKLITPPLFHLPVSIVVPECGPLVEQQVWPANRGDDGRLQSSDSVAVTSAAAHGKGQMAGQPDQATVIANPAEPANGALEDIADARASWFALKLQGALAWWRDRPGVSWTLLWIWCAGSVMWFCHQGLHAVVFWRSVVRRAAANSRVQTQAREVADELGLRRCPRVLLVEATVSPMIWGFGGEAKLLFPAELAWRLDDEARSTLLAHELAHFGRGDHWGRLLELVVTCVFWWHPVVWLARHEIEGAEEECCDAWVVTSLPHAPRRYAEAILDTIDFLCHTRWALPPVASGLGEGPFLRRRLTKIMRGVSPKDMSCRLRCSVAMLAAVMLPMQPFVFASVSSPRRPVDFIGASRQWRVEPQTPRESLPSRSPTEVPSSMTSLSQSPMSSLPRRTAVRSNGRLRSVRGERAWGTAVSADGRFVVQVTTGRRGVFTNLETHEQTELSLPGLTSAAFVPEADSLLTADSSGRVMLWNAVSGKPAKTLVTVDEVIRSLAVSPDGRLIAVGGRDGSTRLIDIESGQLVLEMARQPASVNCVRFSPDGRQLAVASGDWASTDTGQVTIWNVESAELVNTLKCSSAPGAVTFASNEELIVGLWTGHTSLWNLVSRQIVGSAMADKNIVSAASFSPDNPSLREVTFVASGEAAAVDVVLPTVDAERVR